MRIVYRSMPNGALVVGDRDTNLTCVALPSSAYATTSGKKRAEAAVEMISREVALAGKYVSMSARRDYDARQWQRLNGTRED